MLPAFEAARLDSECYFRSFGAMDGWSHEHELYSLALDVMGEEGLDRWLREQYDRRSVSNGLVTTSSWLDIDGGLLINRLCAYLGGHGKRAASQRPRRESRPTGNATKSCLSHCFRHRLLTRSAPR